MSFKSRKTGHITSVFLNTDHYAESVTYGGTAITALVNRDANELRFTEGRAGRVTTCQVIVDVSDVQVPARGDVVVITGSDGGDETFRVDAWRYGDGMHVCDCVLYEDVRAQGEDQEQRW